MRTKEEWINETMESLEGIQRAESDPMLAEKALNRIQVHSRDVISFRTPMVLVAAAMILLLISFNIITFIYFPGSTDMHDNTIRSVATEYFSYIDSLNL